ncbi:hypothetical protein D6827_01995 [Candidatus Parcubacteria bacterium]|nr:MAG: hypothetical protein D6827_01995 [Candidatus Parcubacteria bacterium]
MQTIRTKQELRKDLLRFSLLKRIHKAKGNRNTEKIRELLARWGYEFANLGTASAQYSYSGRVGIHYISARNTWGLAEGTYLVWGAANRNRGGYPLYRGFVKRLDNSLVNNEVKFEIFKINTDNQ